jgi:uncharacterized YccA/Bax inhibitor family protein
MARRGFDSSRGGLFRTANPALRDDVFTTVRAPAGRAMTVQGTVNKTALLLVLAVATAAWTWVSVEPDQVRPWVVGAALIGFGLALATILRRQWSPLTAPLYALVEGVVLGAVSRAFEADFPGIVLQAVSLTFGVLAGLLLVYSSRLIRVTQNFRLGVAAATLGILLVYLASFVLGLFGVRVPFLDDASPVGILISLVIVVVAALNLVLDFDFIERGAEAGAPGYMEWYGAFGLLVTLVWLYLELLRLLSKLRR